MNTYQYKKIEKKSVLFIFLLLNASSLMAMDNEDIFFENTKKGFASSKGQAFLKSLARGRKSQENITKEEIAEEKNMDRQNTFLSSLPSINDKKYTKKK